MTSFDTAYHQISERVAAAAARAGHSVTLLAVGKTRPAAALAALAALGQRDFGENYVQEALAKQRELAGASLRWHLIGPLQSNKCRDVALHFDWMQTLDRVKLIDPLNRLRPAAAEPLNVLIQVNVDDEASKSGCAPADAAALAARVGAAPHLLLRGLMAIPQPHPDLERRRQAFRRMRAMYEELRRRHASVDTLSLGMSEDFELAIEEGSTMVRIGTALFGERGKP